MLKSTIVGMISLLAIAFPMILEGAPLVEIDSKVEAKQQEETTTVLLGFIDALNFYYKSAEILLREDNSTSFRLKMMASLFESKRYLQNGNKELNAPLSIIKEEGLSKQHWYIGLDAVSELVSTSEKIIEAHDKFLEVLKTFSKDEYDSPKFDYAMVEHVSTVNKNYDKMIVAVMNMRWIIYELDDNLTIRGQKAESKNRTGKIPFSISIEQRRELLDEIKSLFGEDLDSKIKDSYCKRGKTFKRDTLILILVGFYRDSLEADIFEQVRKAALPKYEDCTAKPTLAR